MKTERSGRSALRTLREALDAVGHALAAPSASHLMQAEPMLARAVALLPEVLAHARTADRASLVTEIVAARAALARARRLGASLMAVVGAGHDPESPAVYGPGGQAVDTAGLDARIRALNARG